MSFNKCSIFEKTEHYVFDNLKNRNGAAERLPEHKGSFWRLPIFFGHV